MNIRLLMLLITFLTVLTGSQNVSAQEMLNGINLTGAEKIWESPKLSSRQVIEKMKEVKALGYNALRLPLALNFLLHDPQTLPELRKIIRASRKLGLHLVLANFANQLSEENHKGKMEILVKNWAEIIKSLPSNSGRLYIEVANEPSISPDSWKSMVETIVPRLQGIRKDIPLILGATNFNSLFELSRMKPWGFDNIIYTFHFYEPYLFTHQGTLWTGPQNSTLGIPFPFDSGSMPCLDPKAKGTPGEINYRDYEKTGNQIALEDKLGQIAAWAKQNGVKLWCTEYGVTENADTKSRQNYLQATKQVLDQYGISSFVWEYEGNFGIKPLIK